MKTKTLTLAAALLVLSTGADARAVPAREVLARSAAAYFARPAPPLAPRPAPPVARVPAAPAVRFALGVPARSAPARDPGASAVFLAATRAAATHPSTVSTVHTENNRVLKWPIVNADELGEAMFETITSAKKEVFVETMTVDTHAASALRLRDAVQELARTRPEVPVYVRVTARNPLVPGTKVADRIAKFLDSPNVRVGAWESRRVGGRFSLGRLFGTHVSHSKTVVVDNRVALVSDANFDVMSDQLAQNPRGKAWFQTGVLVEGPIAATIREQSANGWRAAAPHVDLPAPPSSSPSPSSARGGGVPMLTLGQEAAAGVGSSANQAYLAAFRAAEKRVCVLTPNLNDRETVEALAEATRHADVYIVLPRGFNETVERLFRQGGGNASNVTRLARLAADPTKLHVRWNAAPDGEPSRGNGVFASHAKSILVDDVVFVGSKNLDTQSAKVSRELSIAIADRAAASRFHDLFQKRFLAGPVAFEGSTPAPTASQ